MAQLALRVESGGIQSTVQDLGRRGAQQFGVPTGGAMDRFALQAANALLGNPLGAAAIEVTGGGAAFEFAENTAFALAGADLGARLNDWPVPAWSSAFARAGSVLAFAGRTSDWGARAYLAVPGGIDTPPVLGSRSTYLAGAFGGLGGRGLRAGDALGALATRADHARLAGRRWPSSARPAYSAAPSLRLLPGPHLDCLDAGAMVVLCDAVFRVSPTSNRMGLRLDGARLSHARPCSLPSLGVFAGVVQVPPDGQPILLMADAQTTGGYPVAGVVAQADLPLAAQLLPGDAVRFRQADEVEAVAGMRAQMGWLRWALADLDGDALAGWAGAHT